DEVAVVIRLVEGLREELGKRLEAGQFARLNRVEQDEETAGLKYARDLGDDARAHLRRQLVEEEEGSDDVLARIGERHRLGIGLEKGNVAPFAQGLVRSGNVTRGEVERAHLQLRPIVLDEGEEAAGAAGKVEQLEAALVPARQMRGDRHEGLTAH